MWAGDEVIGTVIAVTTDQGERFEGSWEVGMADMLGIERGGGGRHAGRERA